MTFAVQLSFACAVAIAIQAPAQVDDPRQTYSQAIGHYNAGRISEARRILTQIIAEHPSYFRGYRVYWQSIGKTEDADAQRAAVQINLAMLRKVSVEDRTESFYYAVMEGERLLGDKDRAEKWRLEAIERLPRSNVAQQEALDRAEKEPDPVKACALFEHYIKDFGENVSWSQLAARHRFDRMIKDAPRFDPADTVAAADQLDRWSVDYVVTYGNPTLRLVALLHIAESMLPLDPGKAVEFAERGRSFVAETASKTEEFDASAAGVFRQVQLLAQVRADRWKQAVICGDDLFPVDQRSKLVTPFFSSRFTEADLRRAHGEALVQLGRETEGCEQLAYAAHLDETLRAELSAALEAASMDSEAREALDVKVAAFERDRTAFRKNKLLATETKRPAPDFSLLNLDGKPVNLKDFRGRTVVLSFWATWCAPCILELDQLTKSYERLTADESVAIVAVTIDADKAKVPPFVAKKGYPFTILYGNGTVEEPYGTGSIPQLYVLDSKGWIRFHQTGFHIDHFDQHLDWMIEAAKAGGL